MNTKENYIDRIFDTDLPTEVRKELLKQIQEITSNFDFIKVQKYMDSVDWAWYDTDGVPSVNDLYTTACDLLVDTSLRSYGHKEPKNSATGGFYAESDYDVESNKFYMSLKFVIEEWDNYD